MPFQMFIDLPPDRTRHGFITVLDQKHRELLRGIPCLGKADNQKAADVGNPTRDPLHKYGDTPLGLYDGFIEEFEQPHPRIGDGWIKLKPRHGDCAAAAGNGREGLGIHAGRGDVLVPTYGCVRVRELDFKLIIATLRKADPKITAIQVWIQ